MSAEFVYPEHRFFEPFRELAETAELEVHELTDRAQEVQNRETMILYKNIPVSLEMAYPMWSEGWTKKERAKVARRTTPSPTQWFWHTAGGIYTLKQGRQWPESFTNEGFRVFNSIGPAWGEYTAQAGELISYGVGLLRPRKAEGRPFDIHLANFEGEEYIPERADSTLAIRGMVHIVSRDVSRGGEWVKAPYALETTNIIMPEILGELHQLYERINDTAFLAAYLRDLRATYTFVENTDHWNGEVWNGPAILNHNTRADWRKAYIGHLGQGIWDEPPMTMQELKDRIKYLVDQIVIDSPTPDAA